MKKRPGAKLARHAADLDRWFREERLSSEAVRQRLAALGCQVSAERLTHWRAQREVRRVQEQLLEQLARGAAQCAEVEQQLERAHSDTAAGAPALAGLDAARVTARPGNALAPKPSRSARDGAPAAAPACARPDADLQLETLIKLHRVLVLKLSLEADARPELLKLAKDLMKPVLDWARLHEKRQDRALAEQERRDQAQRETEDRGLRPETLAKIERELNLF